MRLALQDLTVLEGRRFPFVGIHEENAHTVRARPHRLPFHMRRVPGPPHAPHRSPLDLPYQPLRVRGGEELLQGRVSPRPR